MMVDSLLKIKIAGVKGIESVSYNLETNAHLIYGDARTNAVIKGVDADFTKVSGVPGSVKSGVFRVGTPEQPMMVLGVGVEYQLALQSDRSLEPVTVYLPKKGITDANPMESVSVMNIHPSGTFAIQQEFDSRFVFTNIETVRDMLVIPDNKYSAAELRINGKVKEEEVIKELNAILGDDFIVEDRYRQNKSLFAVMQLEKWVIYAILSLILLLASFTMIGALTMLVLEKQQDIQILKAMGATNKKILRLFLLEGLLLSFTGGFIGTLLALLFCYLQVNYKLIPLQGSFVIDYYPVKVLITDILLVFTTLTFISVLAAWIPSYKASRRKTALKSQ